MAAAMSSRVSAPLSASPKKAGVEGGEACRTLPLATPFECVADCGGDKGQQQIDDDHDDQAPPMARPAWLEAGAGHRNEVGAVDGDRQRGIFEQVEQLAGDRRQGLRARLEAAEPAGKPAAASYRGRGRRGALAGRQGGHRGPQGFGDGGGGVEDEPDQHGQIFRREAGATVDAEAARLGNLEAAVAPPGQGQPGLADKTSGARRSAASAAGSRSVRMKYQASNWSSNGMLRTLSDIGAGEAAYQRVNGQPPEAGKGADAERHMPRRAGRRAGC